MADTKITSLLTPQVTTNPATDVLPIVNIADTSMASSGSTRKITVNTLLGAGGTATLASATITGDLTVDTSTLKVDSTNNRVGIGTATPAQSLDIASGNLQVRTGGTVFSDTFSNYGAALAINAAGSLPIRLQIGGTNAYEITSANVHTWSNVGGVAGTAMTLNSTGLGVGDAPATNSRLTIGSTNATGFQYALRTTGITTGRSQIYLNNTSGDLAAGIEGSTAGASVTGSAAYSAYIGTATSNPFYLVTGGTVRATVDAAGNCGIGVAPSAWGSASYSVAALQNPAGAFWNYQTSIVSMVQNAFYNNSGKYIYKNNGFASEYYQSSGQHIWRTAPSGTATNEITGANAFLQAMTLDASGNLYVGSASSYLASRLNLQVTTAQPDAIYIRNSNAALSTYWRLGNVDSNNRFNIYNQSSVGVYLTDGATSWTGTSDERLKDIIEPISNAVAKVGSLRSVIGKFKADSEGTRRSFLIAQDVQSVLPEAVDDSNADELGIRYTEVIPLLVAAIKELTTRVQTLEAR